MEKIGGVIDKPVTSKTVRSRSRAVSKHHTRKSHKSLHPLSKKPRAKTLRDRLTKMDVEDDAEPQTVQVSLVIYGHGGLAMTRDKVFVPGKLINQAFKVPEGVDQVNVLGLRYAGLDNFGNRRHEMKIDHMLSKRPDIELPEFLDYLNKYYENALHHTYLHEKGRYVLDESGNYIPKFKDQLDKLAIIEKRLAKKGIQVRGNMFGIREKYDKKRAQKIYTGVRLDEYSIDPNQPQRHPELKIGHPLIKIFSIRVNGVEQLKPGHQIVVKGPGVKNYMTLTDVIHESLDPRVSKLLAKYLHYKNKIVVDVVDLTCNHQFEGDPTLEFIGTAR
jgi:hypothetical protein